MIIGTLILLFNLLFGSPADPFVLPNTQKLVKQSIEDSDRKKEVVGLMKAYVKDWKNLQKLNKKQAKALSGLNTDYSVESVDLQEMFNTNRTERRVVEDQLIEHRLEIQSKITDDEWIIIIEQVDSPNPKTFKKRDKEQLKSLIKQEKYIIALENEIKASFTDPQKLQNVVQYLDKYEEDLAGYLFAAQERSLLIVEIMRERLASADDLNEAVKLYEDYRKNALTSFLELREEIIDISTPQQWPKISKALNKLFYVRN